MVRNRRRSTALKMALAGMCTALCIEGMLQRGLAVPVYAEDAEDENYVGSSEWDEFIDYWHSSMNVAIDDLTGGAFDADDVARLNTATFAYASMLYQQYAQQLSADPTTGAIDYSVDIPAGSIDTGWYYRGGQPHSVICFFYGSNGDSVIAKGSSIIYASSDDFTIAIDYTPTANIAFPAFACTDSYGYYYYATQTSTYVSTLTFTGTSCSGFVSNYDFTDSSLVYLSRIATYDTIVTYDEVSLSSSNFVSSGTRPGYFLGGNLKDSSAQPISNTRQQFIRAQVGNNFPDFLLDLKQQLDDNFPEEIVDELWYDPTQGEPLPDVGSLDFLTFPPGLPSVEFNDVELPSEPLPAKALQGAGFWFSSFSNMLDALGVKYIVITFLIIALIMAILKI